MDDSENYETLEHIKLVNNIGISIITQLQRRLLLHDASKLEEPEADAFRRAVDLSKIEYSSEDYNASLKSLEDALKHHYQCNRHHPEHFESGISGMNLVDICEMFIDWSAACQKTKNGNIRKSIVQNQKRFGFSDDLCSIFQNTADLLDICSKDCGMNRNDSEICKTDNNVQEVSQTLLLDAEYLSELDLFVLNIPGIRMMTRAELQESAAELRGDSQKYSEGIEESIDTLVDIGAFGKRGGYYFTSAYGWKLKKHLSLVEQE